MSDDTERADAREDDFELIEDVETSLPDIKKKLADLRGRLASCEHERKEYLDGWQRAKAEHINYKKDEAKRLEDLAQFVSAGFVQDLLPVLDSFELAFRTTDHRPPTTDQETEKGFLLIRSQLMDILKRRGLEEIFVRIGEEFLPEKHESVGEVESDLPAGVIVEEIQKGYALADRVIRPARVRLSKGHA